MSLRPVLVSITPATLLVCALTGPLACTPPAPVLDVPASVTVAEGRSTSFPVSTDAGATLTVESSAPELLAVHAGDAIVVTAGLGAVSGTITVTATAEGESDALSTSATVDVVVTPLTFERTEWTDEGPEAREHGAVFVSADGGTVYLLGGGAYPNFPTQEVLADAWQLDVATSTWSEWSVSGDLPVAGASRRAAQAGNVAFLFGGYDGAFVSNDELYRVDLGSGVFTRITFANEGPLPRSLHAFGFDAEGERLVVYGGFYGDEGGAQDILGDTFVGLLDGDTVTWLEVAGGPPARYGMFAGLDVAPSGRRLVVWSGAGFPAQGDPINAHEDAWVLDLDGDAGPAWRELDATNAPPGRRNGCGVVDPATHGLFVFGGTSDGATSEPGFFVLDLEREAWSPLERDGVPPVRSSSFGAALPDGGIVCGMGNDNVLFQDLFWLR